MERTAHHHARSELSRPSTVAMPKRASEAQLVAAFKVFDKDGSGHLSVEELKAIFCRPTSAGTQMEEAAVEEILKSIDTDCDGMVSYTEFAAAIRGDVIPLVKGEVYKPGTDDSITEAEDLLESKQYEAAVALFTENLGALDKGSDDYSDSVGRCFCGRGESYLKQRRFKAAVDNTIEYVTRLAADEDDEALEEAVPHAEAVVIALLEAVYIDKAQLQPDLAVGVMKAVDEAGLDIAELRELVALVFEAGGPSATAQTHAAVADALARTMRGEANRLEVESRERALQALRVRGAGVGELQRGLVYLSTTLNRVSASSEFRPLTKAALRKQMQQQALEALVEALELGSGASEETIEELTELYVEIYAALTRLAEAGALSSITPLLRRRLAEHVTAGETRVVNACCAALCSNATSALSSAKKVLKDGDVSQCEGVFSSLRDTVSALRIDELPNVGELPQMDSALGPLRATAASMSELEGQFGPMVREMAELKAIEMMSL